MKVANWCQFASFDPFWGLHEYNKKIPTINHGQMLTLSFPPFVFWPAWQTEPINKPFPGNGEQQIRQSSKESTGSSIDDDTDSSSDDEESMPGAQAGPIGSTEADKVPQTKETEAGAEISALVNYVQPVHFSSFENSESKYRFED